jgi:hypothetical protein
LGEILLFSYFFILLSAEIMKLPALKRRACRALAAHPPLVD